MKRLSDNQKKRQGTFEKSKAKVVDFNSDIPEPQGYLNEYGKELYYQIANWCKQKGIFESIDVFNLSRLAGVIDLHSKIAKIIADDPNNGIVKYKNGSNISGEFIALKTLANQIASLSKSYGLDQITRERIIAFVNKKEELPDEIEKHIK